MCFPADIDVARGWSIYILRNYESVPGSTAVKSNRGQDNKDSRINALTICCGGEDWRQVVSTATTPRTAAAGGHFDERP